MKLEPNKPPSRKMANIIARIAAVILAMIYLTLSYLELRG